VINSLAQLPQSGLKVIALSSVLQFKGRRVDPQAIGRELAVETIVIGHVVQRADVLSVSAELVTVRDRSRMWGATYNAKVADILSLQNDIAIKIKRLGLG
jgi:TolB-like protein